MFDRRNSVATLPTFAEIPFWWRSFCSPMDHRPNLLCWDKRLYKRINEFIGDKFVFILGFQSEIWNFMAMKLLFSRIREERKCTISLQ